MTGAKTFTAMLLLFAIGLGLASLLTRFAKPTTDQATPVGNNASATYQKVICLAPSITEIVFALGAADRIVAISGFCDYPPAARSLPQVGSYLNPNFERILALGPDLIIYQGKFEKMARFCQTHALPCLNVKQDGIEDTYVSIQQIGEKLNRADEAQALCDQIRAELQTIRSAVKNKEPVPVFISMFRPLDSFTNLATIGPGTFINELLEIAGGRNIFSDTQALYPSVSKESLLKRRPQAIIEIQPEDKNTPKNRQKMIESWQSFPSIPAVQNQKIHFLADSVLFIPGPRLPAAARLLAERIHPEAFRD